VAMLVNNSKPRLIKRWVNKKTVVQQSSQLARAESRFKKAFKRIPRDSQ
jgi:hypothetical protein